MLIRRIPISKAKFAPYNPRIKLTAADVAGQSLRRSFAEFGNVQVLVWNVRTSHIVGGNQRLQVMLDMGATEVEVCEVDLPLDKEKALNIALNKIQGDWDQDLLVSVLADLAANPELDVTLTGYDMPELRDLIAGASVQADPDKDESFDVEAELEAQQKLEPVTKLGDVIVLGTNEHTQHRLCCGDSTNPEHIRLLMDGSKAALCATDPPYLVDYDGRNRPTKGKRAKPADGDTPTWDDSGQVDLFDKAIAAALAEALRPDAAFYMWHASSRHALVEAAWKKNGLLVHQQIIWVKPSAVPGRSWFGWRHEPCLMGWLKGKKPKRMDTEAHSTVWEVAPIGRGTSVRPDHPTPKPVLLFEIPMRQHTKPAPSGGELAICYEPFAGSGTQIIAAQRLRRRCFAMELSPVYCDLIVRRFIAYAGESAVAPEIAARYRLESADAHEVIGGAA